MFSAIGTKAADTGSICMEKTCCTEQGGKSIFNTDEREGETERKMKLYEAAKRETGLLAEL